MKKAIVLVIDGGGRGSALVDKYQQSPHVSQLLAIPGNDLMRWYTKKPVKIFPKIKTTDIQNIIKVCRQYKVDLVDVAQDDAVADGVTDQLAEKGFKVFGPTRAAGQIEWDKAWARNFMRKFRIPSPEFKVCTSQKQGIDFIKKSKNNSWYVKAAGLAGGKGALFANDNQEALEKINEMKKFGKSGKTFVIEECLKGEEFSSFAIVDGKDFKILGHAQDHKKVYDGDLGPNTGGMGCSSPPFVISKSVEAQVRSIFKKTTAGLISIKRSYLGILYLGGIVDKKGKVYVIEFNARWGDPEAQVIIPSIKNDFYEIATAVLSGKINQLRIKKDNLYRVVVTAASRGYPDDYSQVIGEEIFGFGEIIAYKNAKIFGAGIKISKGKFYANGGRLFYVVGQGKNVAQARQIAYNALSLAYVDGNCLHYRTDIGFRDLARFYRK